MVKLNRLFFTMILLLATVGQFACDLYIPSLPSIAKDFNVPISIAQLSLFTFTIGFSGGALIYGPLSDKYGRRIILLFGLTIATFGGIICSVSWSINSLLFGRLIQGVGFSIAGVTRAVMRDVVHDVNQLAKIGSIMGMLYGIFIAFAPIIGGYIEKYLFWKLNFIILTIYTLILIWFCWFKLEETNYNKLPIKLNQILSIYFQVITNKQFIIYTLTSSLALGGIIAYTTVSAFLLEVKVGLLPNMFGYTYLITCLALVMGGYFNSKMVVHRGINNMILFGSIIFFISGMILALCGLFNLISTWLILIPVAMFFLACGFVFANSNAGALSLFKDKAGTAGAVFACIQMIGGILGSGLISLITLTNQFSLGIMYIIFGLINIGLLKVIISKTISTIK